VDANLSTPAMPVPEALPAGPPVAQPTNVPASAPVATVADEPRAQFGFTLGFTYESEHNSNVTVAAPVLQGRVAVTRDILLDADWGFALLADSEGSTSRVGNPWVAGWYHSQTGVHRWAVGIGVTAPLASVTLGMDGRLQRQVYNEAFAMWGAWDMWRWTPGRMAAPIQARVVSSLSSKIDLEAHAAVAPLFGVRNGESRSDLVSQAAIGVCGILPGARICPRLQAVMLPSTSIDDLQLAAGLRVTADWGHLFVDILVNLDEPLGVVGRGTRSWGIQIGKAFAQ
jgi:hypothetical protein